MSKVSKLEPLNDRIIVRLDPVADKTPGGLHLPPPVGKQRDKAQRGTVVVAGPGVYNEGVFRYTVVSAGDVVLFGPFAGHEIEYNGEKLLVIREDEILTRVK